MAEGTARSLERAQVRPERRVHLRLVARSDEGTGSHKPMPLSAPSVPPPVLSSSADIWGIDRAAWLAAGALYAAIAAAVLLIGWRVAPPEPWPASEAVFQVVFEEPAPPPAAPPVAEPPPRSASEASPPPISQAEPQPAPPPQLAQPEAAPPVAEPEPAPVELPKPPPRKPAVRPRSVATAPARPTPSAAPAEPQVAALPLPAAPAPVLPPQPISGLAINRKPDYPAEARRRGQQGRVVLRIEVSAAGAPLGITVLTSSGHSVLDQAAIRAVESWRFNPATQAGAPVPGVAEVPVQFRLED